MQEVEYRYIVTVKVDGDEFSSLVGVYNSEKDASYSAMAYLIDAFGKTSDGTTETLIINRPVKVSITPLRTDTYYTGLSFKEVK